MRKKITLISAIGCILFFVAYAVILLQQSSFVDKARQEFYDQKIVKQQQHLQHNLDILNDEVKEISKLASITEVFVQKSVTLEQFPNAIKNGVRAIRFTDAQGRIIYSSHENAQEFNRQISHKVLEWADNSKSENLFFFVDRDNIISVQRYQNPYVMGMFGYIIVEFSTSQLFRRLNSLNYFVRIIENQPAVLVLSDTQNIDMELASVLALKKDSIPPRNGRVFDVPMLGQVVYYIGEDFYLPPIMTVVSVVILLIGLMLLRLFSVEPKTKEEYGSKITQLIQDIEDGNNYNEIHASEAISNASNFGIIKDLDDDDFEDIDNTDDFEELRVDIEEISDFTDMEDKFDELDDNDVDEEVEELSDFSDMEVEDEVEDEEEEIDEFDELDDVEVEDEVEEEEIDEFEELDDNDVEVDEEVEELSDFSDIEDEEDEEEEIDEFEELDDNDVEVDEEVEELSDFSDIEDEEEEIDEFEELDDNDVEVDEEVEELSDFTDIDVEDEVEEEEEIDEFEELDDVEVEDEVEEEEIDEFDELDDNDVEVDEDKIIDVDEENEDTLQQIIPLDEVDDEVGESFIPHFALGNFKNETVQKYMDELADILEQYDISNYAVAEEDNNLYIFNGDSFGAQFIIDKEDGLYQEVLSKGNALSLSGDLMDSEYLENLFSRELLSEFTELYVRPIMEDGDVKGIVVLARDGEELSREEKKDLLKNH